MIGYTRPRAVFVDDHAVEELGEFAFNTVEYLLNQTMFVCDDAGAMVGCERIKYAMEKTPFGFWPLHDRQIVVSEEPAGSGRIVIQMKGNAP